MPPYSDNSFIRSQNGDTLYAYSTTKGAGGVNETIIDIENTGLDDLLVKIQYVVDWVSVTTSAGVSVSVDDYDIFFMNAAPGGAGVTVSPQPWEFTGLVVPAQSHLKVVAHCHAGDTGAFRSAQLVAYPLRVTTNG
jgi:hypothetical protein|tara:strand:- start:190 stop:597 length:408 start_codon:yes stop_codon:yes gene_type:complete